MPENLDIGNKSIEINGIDYPVEDEVWNLFLALSAERDYYKKKLIEHQCLINMPRS